MSILWFDPLFAEGSETLRALQSIAEEIGEECTPAQLHETIVKWCNELNTVIDSGTVNPIRLSLIINELRLGEFQTWLMREGVEHYVTFLTQIYGGWMQYERKVQR